ncbi:hypothetical protein AB6V29_02590 [Microbacterium sp. 20-116]|uniref:hypothetical protein n=1 Tax=Microbacterium sp. 20-116 TaxID=3239883 RepID=UPI0034E1A148
MKEILAAGLARLVEMRGMLVSAHSLDSSGAYERSLAERELISNACFLSVFIALEEFYEAAFAHYLVGRMSTARWKPSKYGRPPSTDHAQKMLIGTQRYVDWSTPSTVVRLADLYFVDGEPFRTPIASAQEHLNRMKTVRNATAHISVTTQAALDAVHAKWTGSAATGVTAYGTLMSTGLSGSHSFYGYTETVVQAIMLDIANRS